MSERERCLECLRPVAHCLCGSIKAIDHRTEVLILQHPRERSHPFNTARIAERCLQHARILVDRGGRLKTDPTLRAQLAGYGLLYPGPDARDLSTLTEAEMPRGLVVIDGTWHHARAMYRDIGALRDLPKFSLPEGGVSGFKIRRQPHEYCLSTLEAIHAALGYTEPDTPDLGDLLAPFEAMQEMQLTRHHAPSPRTRRRPRSERGPELPAAFREHYESLVVVYGELTPRTCEEMKQPLGDRPLLTLAAERPATGERMMAVLAHEHLSQGVWPFFRLDAEGAPSTSSQAEMVEAWRSFQRPGDVLATWNAGTAQQWKETFGGQARPLVLKSVYCNHRSSRGTLDAVVESEGLLAPSEREQNRTQRTRTEERLANAVAVAKLLHSLTQGEAAMGEWPSGPEAPGE
ncbi:MAG: DTW domain-containing protein [Planctomycetota bacterium]|nr:DTW domain-containing protein [Planctomycetota bacterium]